MSSIHNSWIINIYTHISTQRKRLGRHIWIYKQILWQGCETWYGHFDDGIFCWKYKMWLKCKCLWKFEKHKLKRTHRKPLIKAILYPTWPMVQIFRFLVWQVYLAAIILILLSVIYSIYYLISYYKYIHKLYTDVDTGQNTYNVISIIFKAHKRLKRPKIVYSRTKLSFSF